MPWGFYITGFFFKYFLRQNVKVTWMLHHTSTVHYPQNIKRGKMFFQAILPVILLMPNMALVLVILPILDPMQASLQKTMMW